ncbi:hypothetical protein BOX15_Mlig012231g4, partial [Macrostomum lignano]
ASLSGALQSGLGLRSRKVRLPRSSSARTVWGFPPRRQGVEQPVDLLASLARGQGGSPSADRRPLVLLISASGSRGICAAALLSDNAFEEAAEPSADTSGRLWCRFRLADVLPDVGVSDDADLPLLVTPFGDAVDTDGRPLGECRNLAAVNGVCGCRLVQRLAADLADARAAAAPAPSQLGRIAGERSGAEPDELAVAARLARRLGRSHGRALLACPAGSRRYNLHGPASDHDLAVVYRAPLRSLLGLPGLRPADSLQSSGPADPIDCRATELGRFLELLLAGDPKAVECLFLRQEDLHFGRPADRLRLAWLFESKRRFLTPRLLRAYRSELEGAKGLRKLDRLRAQWLSTANEGVAGAAVDGVTPGSVEEAAGGAKATALGARLRKLYCILLRLADCCAHAASGELPVRFEAGSERHRLLSWIRFGPPAALSQADELRMRDALRDRLAAASSAAAAAEAAEAPETLARLQAEANDWLIEHRLACHADGDERLLASELEGD